MTETAIAIQETIAQLTQMQAVQRHYDSLVTQEDQMEAELETIEQQLTKELKDVEKLEKVGVTSMFYKVLGSKQQQLEKERQEYLELSLKHTDHLTALKVLRYEKEVIEGKVINIQGLEKRLQDLKNTREKEILSRDSQLRNSLLALHTKMDNTMQRQGHITAAAKKGAAALMSLDKVIGHFRKAKDWGNWDMGTNRGRYYEHKKHNAINYAVAEANRSNVLLQSFTEDLRQVGYNAGHISIGFKSFSGFMDVLFDNLISDWIMQSKIKNALTNTEAVRDRVASIVATLENELEKLKQTLEELHQQKESILMSS